MARSSTSVGKHGSNGKQRHAAPLGGARVRGWADKGVHTSDDMKSYMSDLMCDLSDDRVDALRGNAICNAAGKLLATVAMEYKYGRAAAGAKPARPARLQLT